jgi:hypothetical protein
VLRIPLLAFRLAIARGRTVCIVRGTDKEDKVRAPASPRVGPVSGSDNCCFSTPNRSSPRLGDSLRAVATIAAPEPTAAALAWPILQERARAYAEAARAPATLRAYAADWRAFGAWCAAHTVDESKPIAPTHERDDDPDAACLFPKPS